MQVRGLSGSEANPIEEHICSVNARRQECYAMKEEGIANNWLHASSCDHPSSGGQMQMRGLVLLRLPGSIAPVLSLIQRCSAWACLSWPAGNSPHVKHQAYERDTNMQCDRANTASAMYAQLPIAVLDVQQSTKPKGQTQQEVQTGDSTSAGPSAGCTLMNNDSLQMLLQLPTSTSFPSFQRWTAHCQVIAALVDY